MKSVYTRIEIHNNIYYFSLLLLVICLPLSRFLLSMSLFLLLLNWLIEGNYRNKISLIRHNVSILLFSSVFLLYLFGYFYSDNESGALGKVKNALPVLVLPYIIGTSNLIPARKIKILLLSFSGSVVIAALICLILYLINGLPPGSDFRKVSVFMSHIRFSLMIDFSIFILFYFLVLGKQKLFKYEKQTLLITALFLIYFLFFLRSATGIAIFFILLLLFIANIGLKQSNKFVRLITVIIIIGFPLGFLSILYSTWTQNFRVKTVSKKLEIKTLNGRNYTHDFSDKILENGNINGFYVCEEELQNEWSKVSSIPYDSFDKKGQSISYTLKRYLTSKGLRKDSAGVHSLNSADILKVENGIANYKFKLKPGLKQRLYETMWEFQLFKQANYVQYHSFGQRLIFYKLALSLIKEKLWLGYGTGDVNPKMYQKAAEENISVDPAWEGKPHNQFAFFIIAFGLSGLIWISFCWTYPVIALKAYKLFLFNLFWVIMLISMTTIDSLESYDSVVFFSFFYCIFVFNLRSKYNQN